MSRPSLPSPQKERSDRQLLKDLRTLVDRDHRLEAELIAVLGEVDARRLYLEQAHPSMFHYCLKVLHFAEGVAYKRIAVARAARKHPELLAALEAGELHLTAASLIAPHLSAENAEEWLTLARHRTAQQIRQQIADRQPRPDFETSVRRAPSPRPRQPSRQASCPAPEPASTAASAPLVLPISQEPAEARKARCEPLGAERYCIRFRVDSEAHAELQELQSLLRPSIPDGDMGKILTRAIGVLLKQVRKQKIASCSLPRRPRTSPRGGVTEGSGRSERWQTQNPSRHISAAIRREVWKRDGGRCTFKSRQGRECSSSEYLEFHHKLPWAHCREHTPSNIALRCRAHNQYEAEREFGSEWMGRFRRGSAGDRVGDRRVDRADVGIKNGILDGIVAGDGVERDAARVGAGAGTHEAGRGALGASGRQRDLIPVR